MNELSFGSRCIHLLGMVTSPLLSNYSFEAHHNDYAY